MSAVTDTLSKLRADWAEIAGEWISEQEEEPQSPETNHKVLTL
jgi:hypothetical protein